MRFGEKSVRYEKYSHWKACDFGFRLIEVKVEVKVEFVVSGKIGGDGGRETGQFNPVPE